MNGLVWCEITRAAVSTAGVAPVSAHLGRLPSWRGHADYGNHRGHIASGDCQRTLADPSVVSVSREFHQSGLLDGLRLRIPCHSLTRDSRLLSREASSRGLVSSDSTLRVVLGLQVAARAGPLCELSSSRSVDETGQDWSSSLRRLCCVPGAESRVWHDLAVLVRVAFVALPSLRSVGAAGFLRRPTAIFVKFILRRANASSK